MQIATDVRAAEIAVGEPTAPQRAIRDSGFDVEVIRAAAALDAVAAEWQALERLTHASAVFQSHAQLRIWARHFIPSEGGHIRLHVAIVRKNGRPVLILPLVISGSPLLRVARMAGDPIAQYSEILVDPALATHGAFDAALRSAKAAGADVIVLRRLRDDSPLLELARPYLRPPIERQFAPFADLSGLTDHAAFLQSLSKNVRRALRNRQKHLHSAGKNIFELLPAGKEARAAIAEAFDLKRKWLIQRGALSSAFADPATRECLLDLAGNAASGAVVLRLLVNGELAAFRLGFEHGGTHFAYLSAYDERFADVSPGKLLMEFCVSGFRERGMKRLDMLAPAGQHKSDWCREETGVGDYSLPLTGIGRLYADLYQARLRPALSRAWHSMPTTLRSLVTALFVRI